MCRNQWKSFAAVHIHVITSWYIMCSFMIFISVSFTSCCWGPVCFPFSMMGSRRQMDDPNFCTHTAYFENVACTHDLNIIENVPEYGVDIVRAALGPRFDIKAVKIDPRILGLGVARSRIYIVAIHKSKLKCPDVPSGSGLYRLLLEKAASSKSLWMWWAMADIVSLCHCCVYFQLTPCKLCNMCQRIKMVETWFCS